MMDDSWCDKSFTTTSINKQQNKQQTPKNNKVKHFNKSSNDHHLMSAADIKKTSTSINEWGDLFDDGDDAMLIEATVLTESQQMKGKSHKSANFTICLFFLLYIYMQY